VSQLHARSFALRFLSFVSQQNYAAPSLLRVEGWNRIEEQGSDVGKND